MIKTPLKVNGIEAGLVAILLLLCTWPALTWRLAVAIPLLNACFLFGAFLLIRAWLFRGHRYLARAFFALTALVLLAEITLHHFTGLHLNRFILSLALQPQAASQIGLTGTVWWTVFLFLAVVFVGARFLPWHISLPARPLLAATGLALVISQSLFAFLLYQRDIGLLQSQHNLVFFKGLHHYYAEKIFAPVFGPRPNNPFARSFNDTGEPRQADTGWAVTTPRNLLLIVVDSMRAKDIKADPTLAPNLYRWGSHGYFSLGHSSVSNCTHFGMHTLLTGDLATSFSTTRHGGKALGIFAALSGNGYRLTSAEAQSLDWYDIAATYLPDVDRAIADAAQNADRDAFAATKTLVALSTPSDEPWAHLAYLSGPHFPYGESTAPSLDGYRAKIKETDTLIGALLDELEAKGALENTLVIVTSDHGEELAEDGTIGHGSLLTDDQTTVPLLVLGAQLPADWIRSHQDIMPLVRAELGAAPLRAQPTPYQVLTGCDYEYPSSFAYIDSDGRVDFRFEDGVLSPVRRDSTLPPAIVDKAGLKLIEIMKRSGE